MLDAARRIAAYIDAGGAPEFLQQTIVYDAVCMNLLHAAHQAGFGAQWLTGFAAYDPFVKTAVGVTSEESVLGYIHIGTRAVQPPERDRPEASALLTVAAP